MDQAIDHIEAFIARWQRADGGERANYQLLQAEIETLDETETATTTPIVAGKPRAWPKDAIEQVRAVAETLAASTAPLSVDDITARFIARGAWKKRVPRLLEMLVALGRAREANGGYQSIN